MNKSASIPQPRTVPILGNLPDIDGEHPVQSFLRLAKTHGPIMRLTLLGRMITLLGSFELVNEVCDEERFGKKIGASLNVLRDIAGDGLFTAHSDEANWGVAHRLLMPAFGPLGLRNMFDGMTDIAEQMMLRWERFGDTDFDVADHMTRLTLDTIALCAFNYRFNSFYQNEMHPYVHAMVASLSEAGARVRRPSFVNKLMLANQKRYEADIALQHDIADTIVQERRRDPAHGTYRDLLDSMLEGEDPVTGKRLSDENIRFQMVTFLTAGHETTSGMLSFAIYFLLKNPDVMDRARAVVDNVLGDAPPCFEDLAKLRYIEQIFMETLRLWPTAPVFTVAAKQDALLGGRYPVTAGSPLLVLIPMLHRDPAIWGDDAEDFKPERFAPELAEKRPANAWKPFGNGMRACIGRGFAMQEAQLVLAMMLQRFTFTAADPDYQLRIVETLTIKPQGLRIRARRREDIKVRPRPRTSTIAVQTTKPDVHESTAKTGESLLVLFGSNTGSSEAFAQRIANEAGNRGYQSVAAPLNDYVGRLPRDGAVIVVTASYEGQPPDNARSFLSWIETLPDNALAGLSYAVFGCGNRQWAQTYQAIPKRMEKAFEKAGAFRLVDRGEADAGGDFFGAFDEWNRMLEPILDGRFGMAQGNTPDGDGGLAIEILASSRQTTLRLTDLAAGTILENRELVDMSAPLGRSKRHLEIALPQGMSYETGDYLAVLPRNSADEVDRVLRRFGVAADTEIMIRADRSGGTTLPANRQVSVTEVLFNYVELSQPATRSQLGLLAGVTSCPPEKASLTALCDETAYAAYVLDKRLSLIDLLERFPSCDLKLADFISALPPLRVRQYSIASSPLRDPTRCSLTIAVLDAPALSGAHRFRGVATGYLAALKPGSRLSVAVRPSQTRFHPPSDCATPLILICAGSGIAPFRGFLQERALQKQAGSIIGPSLLFFGVDHPDVDFLYRDELREWQRMGIVDVRPAFSEAPEEGIRFVQHRLWQDRSDVADCFRAGAQVFVCGDGKYMAPAVRKTCVEIYMDAMKANWQMAEAWADKVEREYGRYVADVFA